MIRWPVLSRLWKPGVDLPEEQFSSGQVWFGQIDRASHADALAYVSAWVEKYIEAPAAVGVGLHRYQDGYLFEVHERGIGHRAWLPSVLRVWDAQRENGEAEHITLALERVVEGVRNGDRISFIVLPEGQTGFNTTPGLVADGSPLRSLRPDRGPLERSSSVFLIVGVLVLLTSLGLRWLLPPETAHLHWTSDTPAPVSVVRLPIGQWPALVQIARSGGYVVRMQYRGSVWQLIQGASVARKSAVAAPTVSPRKSGKPGVATLSARTKTHPDKRGSP